MYKFATKLIAIIALATTFVFFSLDSASAVCPVCTVAVGAGLGLSRWLGIDDTVSSIWIGGLLMSLGFWTIDWLKKKIRNYESKIKNKEILIFAFWYIITLVPLWYSNVIGHPLNTIFGIDKIIFGTFIGSFVFFLATWLDKRVRQIKGKQLFQFQKVIFPLFFLVIASLVFYYYGGYLN